VKRSCIIKWPQSEGSSEDSSYGFILYSFFMGFAIPLSLIMIFYYLVIRKLKTIGPKNKSKEKKRSHRKVTHLVLTIITAYVVFWSPYWVMQIFLISTPPEHCKSKLELIVFILVGCLAYSNSSINPFIYAFLSDNFKRSFLKACSCTANAELKFKLQTDNSLFMSRFSRNRNSEKRSMVTKLNRVEKCNGNELANVSTGLIDQETKDTECDSPCNRRKLLQTDL
jgi:allatostatin C receptor